jgi:aspartate-semialdehyde dehydrogenase
MPLGGESVHVVIAGATSLRGKDLKQWIEESGFPAGEVRLLDEEFAAGTLTDVAGEPAIVQGVNDASFEGSRFVFFAGSSEFANRNAAAAERAGATVIDLTGGLATMPRARRWIPHLDSVLSPPAAIAGPNRTLRMCLSPSTPAIVACSLSAGLAAFSPTRVAIVFFHPVSERGQAGVDELESQTGKLLSLQAIPQDVFDAQVAFNLLDRWGAASGARLSDVRTALAREVRSYLDGRVPVPAMMLVQAPVFFGHSFACYVEFPAPPEPQSIVERLAAAGFKTAEADGPGPSNLSVAGEAQPLIGLAEQDENIECGYWLWGAADNLRAATANATRIAESLLAS